MTLPEARAAGRPLVMGVVNVTPDSFSDGGAWFTPEAAVAHGHELVAQGADLLDIGGESTRPGAERPSAEEEQRRVLPVVEELGSLVPVSVDTMRADVAAAALDAGAVLVNDVSGGLADPDMAPLVAARRVPFVAMHWRGHSHDMQARAHYDDVVEDVTAELAARVEALVAAGIRPADIVLDPGFGFAKLAHHNWELLRRLEELTAVGHRVLIGTSRKGFLGLVGRTPDTVRPPLGRDVATAATSLYAAQRGVWAVRVHDVAGTVDALDVADALRASS
ncbi:MAG: folP [Ornithinibacter sp.]|nr:folP [Ornithinibacter sp.]